MLRCADCGLAFRDEWSTGFDEELYAYYTSLGLSREACYGGLNGQRHRELLDDFATRVRGRRLLDVGCGTGSLVASAHELGWEARGIDLAEPAIAICKRFGVQGELLDFFDATLDDQRFDVIHMSELIEHVPAPRRFVERAGQLLADDGVLYLTTPNFDSLSRRVLGGSWGTIHREHLSYFDPVTMRSMIGSVSSLRLELLESRNVAVSPLLVGARRRVSSLLRRPAPAQAPSSSPPDHREHAVSSTALEADQALRAGLEKSALLRAAKGVVNRALDAAGAGDTLVVRCRRPRA